jgi:hypothetical protein
MTLNVEETARLVLEAMERGKLESPEAFLEETGMSEAGFELVCAVMAENGQDRDPVAREQAAIQIGYQLRKLVVEGEDGTS